MIGICVILAFVLMFSLKFYAVTHREEEDDGKITCNNKEKENE